MKTAAMSEIEGRKQMDAQDMQRERRKVEDGSSFDPWENFRQELTHKRVIQDWE